MIRNRQKLDKQLKPIEECEMNKTTEEKLKYISQLNITYGGTF